MKTILITQCLQNDFVKPIKKFDSLPNQLHIGSRESKRLLGETPDEGMLLNMMKWAYSQPQEELKIINIRDWHDPNDPKQQKHLNRFGHHCLQESEGAELVFEKERKEGRDVMVNASGLNDFVDTGLMDLLEPFKEEEVKVGIIGVWTEAKVSFLAYDIITRFPNFEVGVCGALTASSSTHMHFVALEQLKNVLGVNIYPSITEFIGFLSGKYPDLLDFSNTVDYGTELIFEEGYQFAQEDKEMMQYLYRNSRSVKFKVLDGGFSGNIVLKGDAEDVFGHEEVPTVLKIGPRNPMAQERDSFEKIRDVLGNNAPSIVEYVESESRGGIKYRYASMFDDEVITFQKFFMTSDDEEKIKEYLDVVYVKQLGRFYKAATLEKLDLLEYYEFSSKYKDSVRKKVTELVEDCGEQTYLEYNGVKTYNICNFYDVDLLTLKESYAQNHFCSYLHGDLNGANIIIDAQDNVWLIDFFHTHRGHVLKDLIKLENDICYIFMQVNSTVELQQATKVIDTMLDVDDLAKSLPKMNFDNTSFNKAYNAISYLRGLYPALIHSDRSPYQLFIGLLRYSVHTLSFDECNIWQRKLALYTSGLLAQKIKTYLSSNNELRIDYMGEHELLGKIGMTILPGRRDRNRNLQEDINKIQTENIRTVFTLITEDEMEEYGVDELLKSYEENGLSSYHCSIVDQFIPTKEEMKEITASIHQEISNGNKVLIHCVGGIGRTGTAVACYLREYHGYSTQEAISLVRKYRSPRAVETKVQEDFIASYWK